MASSSKRVFLFAILLLLGTSELLSSALGSRATAASHPVEKVILPETPKGTGKREIAATEEKIFVQGPAFFNPPRIPPSMH